MKYYGKRRSGVGRFVILRSCPSNDATFPPKLRPGQNAGVNGLICIKEFTNIKNILINGTFFLRLCFKEFKNIFSLIR